MSKPPHHPPIAPERLNDGLHIDKGMTFEPASSEQQPLLVTSITKSLYAGRL